VQIQDVVLSGIQHLQRITHDALKEQQILDSNIEYRRITGSEGREYNLSLNLKRETFDGLVAANHNLVVWCQDEAEGRFHAIMELADLRDVSYPSFILTSLNLLVRDDVFQPDKFNPKVFA
jgi:hypothetical protein